MSELWQYLTLTGEPTESRRSAPARTAVHVEEPLPLDITLPEPVRPEPQPASRRKEPAVDVFDAIGIGLGLDNLGLAALADGVTGLNVRFFDEHPKFSPAPDTRPVSFLADLVTLVEPASRWSYLSYLRAHHRIHPFYVDRRFEVPRPDYDGYCRWVATTIPNCRFGTRVDAVSWAGDHFVVRTARVAHAIRDESGTEGDGVRATVRTKNVVLGSGVAATRPRFLRPLAGVIHAPEGMLAVTDDYRVPLDHAVTGSLFLQRPSAPDRDPYRNATILNAIAGRAVLPVP